MRRWRQQAPIHRTARRHIPRNIRVYKAINGNHSWLSSTDHSYIPLSRTTSPAKNYVCKIGFLHSHFHRKLLCRLSSRKCISRATVTTAIAPRDITLAMTSVLNVPVVVPCLCSYSTPSCTAHSPDYPIFGYTALCFIGRRGTCNAVVHNLKLALLARPTTPSFQNPSPPLY